MKKAVLSFDVEAWFFATDFANIIPKESVNKWDLRLDEPIHYLLDTLDAANAKASFFIVGKLAKRIPALIREIATRGHEIGCHSMNHKLLYALTEEELTTEIVDSKKMLEDTVGGRIEGFRAPTFSLTAESIPFLKKAGYTYDSSLWQGRNILRKELEESAIKEFPVSTRKFLGKLIPFGGGYLRLLGTGFYNPIFKDNDSFLVLYLHPWEFDPKHPRIKNVSIWSQFKHYNGLCRSKKMLSFLLDKFSWGSFKTYS